MPDLIPATGALLERILDDTHSVWGEGLTRRAYGQWNVAQARTAWGEAHLARMALVESGRLLASGKRYLLTTRLDGRSVPTLGIGAVFTPPAQRGQGWGSMLVTAMCEAAAREGYEQALLFSEIGAEFYARLGFVTVPLTFCDIDLHKGAGAPAITMRAGEDDDADRIVAMLAEQLRGYRFGIDHDADMVRFGVVKKRLLAGFDPRHAVEYFVVEEGYRAVAFVVIQVTRSGGQPDWWSLEACGDRDPTGARVGAMLQVLLARAPASPRPLIRSWWPSRFLPPQLQCTCFPSTAVTMMMKPIGGGTAVVPPLDASELCYWHGDAF